VEKFALPPPGARVELMLYLAAIPNADDVAEIRALIEECEKHLRP
jgi:hypothetical protein